jgi:hypothetical protein
MPLLKSIPQTLRKKTTRLSARGFFAYVITPYFSANNSDGLLCYFAEWPGFIRFLKILPLDQKIPSHTRTAGATITIASSSATTV